MPLAVQLEEKYTYKDYLNWPDDERWELIGGIPYNMSPAPTRWHQELVVKLLRHIANFLDDKPYKIFVAPFDVRLPEEDENDEITQTVVQPDLVVICDEKKLDDRGCLGAPDFIIEILSESTAGRDLHEKLFLYERHGVKEYWVVDLWSKTVTVHTIESDNKYGKVSTYNVSDKIPSIVLKGFAINLSDLFAGLPG